MYKNLAGERIAPRRTQKGARRGFMISMEEWQLGGQKSGDVTRRFTLGFCFVEGDWGPKLMDPNDN